MKIVSHGGSALYLLLLLSTNNTTATEDVEALSSIINYFSDGNVDEYFVELYIGYTDQLPTNRQKIMLPSKDDLNLLSKNVEFKNFIVITDQMEGIDQLSIVDYKPKLTVLVKPDRVNDIIDGSDATSNETNNIRDTSTHITSEPREGVLDRPTVVFTVSSRSIEYRNAHGEKYHGIWSNYFSKVFLKKPYQHKDLNQIDGKNFRVAYNNVPAFFTKRGEQFDMFSTENYILDAYIKKRRLRTTWIFAGKKWGDLNKTTNSWEGVQGLIPKVGFNQADIGVCSTAYTATRNQLITYSVAVDEFVKHWVSKSPGRVSPTLNIVLVYDWKSWLALFISIIAVGFTLLLMVKVYSKMGYKEVDIPAIFLLPFGIISAEAFPTWFEDGKKKGAGGCFLLLSFGIAASVIAFGFNCNLRAILLKPNYNPPLDSAEDIVKENKAALIEVSTWHYAYLSTSENPWHRKILDNYFFRPKSMGVIEKYENQAINENTVTLVLKRSALHIAKNSKKLAHLPRPVFHISKEKVRPHYVGWVMQKGSRFEDDINLHVLRCHQAGFIERSIRHIQTMPSSADELEKLGFNHVALPFYLLISGVFLSILEFLVELLINKYGKKQDENIST